MLGVVIKLERTRSGHYCVDLDGNVDEANIAEAFADVTLNAEDEKTWKKGLKKLHEQFAHTSEQNLNKLLVSSGRWKVGMLKVLENIEDTCTVKVCKLAMRNSHKPVVAIPRAT